MASGHPAGLCPNRVSGNSLGTTTVPSHPLQVVGLPYLHEVLKPVVNRIFEEKKYVELDPGKMELSRSRRVAGDVWAAQWLARPKPSPSLWEGGHPLLLSPWVTSMALGQL